MRYSNKQSCHPEAEGGLARLYASDVPRIHREIVEEARRFAEEARDEIVASMMATIADRARFADRYLMSLELTHVAVDAAWDVPPMPLASVCPSPDGVIVYSGGLPEVAGPEGLPLPTASGKVRPLVVAWNHLGEELFLTGWAHIEADGFRRWVPVMSDRVHDPKQISDPDSYRAGANAALCALMMSTWQLMRLPVVTSTTSAPPPVARKRGRAPRTERVRVLKLSELQSAERGRWIPAPKGPHEGLDQPAWGWVPPQHLLDEDHDAARFTWPGDA